MIANVTPRRKRFVSVKIPLKSSKSLSENPEILNEHKLNLVCLYTSREIFAFSLVNQCGFAMVPNLNFNVLMLFNYQQEHYYGVEAKHECMDTVFQATYCSTCFL